MGRWLESHHSHWRVSIGHPTTIGPVLKGQIGPKTRSEKNPIYGMETLNGREFLLAANIKINAEVNLKLWFNRPIQPFLVHVISSFPSLTMIK